MNKGDIIRIKDEILAKRRKQGDFTPADLVGVGWPNCFLVHDTKKGNDGKDLVVLDCCHWMVNPATAEFLCAAHPVDRFEPTSDKKRRNGRQIVIQTPLGKILQVNYHDDDNPELEIQVGDGKPLVLTGEISRIVGDKFKEAGLL